MSFESFPTGNIEERDEQVSPDGEAKVERENSTELEARIPKILSERLGQREGVLTDDELVSLVGEISQEVGLRGSVFEDDEGRPKVFYRVFRNSEAISELVDQQETAIRPLSFSMPGVKGEIPLSYGGNDPVVTRIVDTTGEWKDTSKLFGYGEEWGEAMNLDPVALKKIFEQRVGVPEVYRQVGRESQEEGDVLEVTYVVDKEKTRALKGLGSLEVFADDAGFWKEISKRARNFSASKHSNPGLDLLNSKYLDYFRATMEVDVNSVTDIDARKALEVARGEISAFFNIVRNLPEDDSNWTSEKKQEVLDKLSGVLDSR